MHAVSFVLLILPRPVPLTGGFSRPHDNDRRIGRELSRLTPNRDMLQASWQLALRRLDVEAVPAVETHAVGYARAAGGGGRGFAEQFFDHAFGFAGDVRDAKRPLRLDRA